MQICKKTFCNLHAVSKCYRVETIWQKKLRLSVVFYRGDARALSVRPAEQTLVPIDHTAINLSNGARRNKFVKAPTRKAKTYC